MYRQSYKLRLRRQQNYSRNGNQLYFFMSAAAVQENPPTLSLCRGLEGGMKFATFLYNKHFQAYQKDAFALVQTYDTLARSFNEL